MSARARPSTKGPVKRWWLGVVGRWLNPVTLRAAHAGFGPFAVVHHVGRRSGKPYETPIMLARVPEGFVAELTYGPQVDWYRNIVAAGGCEVSWKRRNYRIDRIARYDVDAGRRAFGVPARYLLQLLRRRDFRLLHVAEP